MLGLPLIRNVKHLDPADPSTPEVIQIETAMGAAIEVFEGARTIEVGRDRFVPVKTTNDLLVLRSDIYDLGRDFVLDQASDEVPFIELDGEFYKLVGDFDKRFPEGAPSLREADSLKVDGDFTFGHGVRVVGDVELESPLGAAGRRPAPCSPGTPMADLLPVPDLVERILASVSPLPDFPQPLMDALGLAVAEDVHRPDRAAELRQLRDGRLRRRPRRRRSPRPPTQPGAPAGRRRDRRRPGADLLALSPGTAVKIMTGAPVPRGCDAVVPYEWTDRGVAQVRITQVPAGRPAHPHARRGRRRRATCCSSTAPSSAPATSGCSPRSAGPPSAAARARGSSSSRPAPSCASPAPPLGHDSIYDGNSYLLAAAARTAGAIAYRVGIVPDDPRTFTDALSDQLVRADLVVTSGGVSEGDYDVVKEALGQLRHGVVRRGRDAARQAAGLRHGRRGRHPDLHAARATRSRRTSPSRCSCCPRSAG